MSANMLYGLLRVLMLSVPECAEFAVLFGYMGTLTVLVDVSVSNTLTPLVGEQIDNLQLIANYVAAIWRIPLHLYLVVHRWPRSYSFSRFNGSAGVWRSLPR